MVSRQLDNFVDRGFLKKDISAHSEREKVYKLTAKGHGLVNSIKRTLED